MQCLNVDVPVGDEEYMRVCRDILNACIRNTEEAEHVANVGRGGAEGNVLSAPSSDSALGSFSGVGPGASSMLIGGTSTPPQSVPTQNLMRVSWQREYEEGRVLPVLL